MLQAIRDDSDGGSAECELPRQGDDGDRGAGRAADALHVRVRLRHVRRTLRQPPPRQDTQAEERH